MIARKRRDRRAPSIEGYRYCLAPPRASVLSATVKLAAVLPILLVANCGTASRVQATIATADSVSYQFPAGQQDEAMHQAMLYCANLGRSAVLRSVQPADGGLSVGTYDCR